MLIEGQRRIVIDNHKIGTQATAQVAVALFGLERICCAVGVGVDGSLPRNSFVCVYHIPPPGLARHGSSNAFEWMEVSNHRIIAAKRPALPLRRGVFSRYEHRAAGGRECEPRRFLQTTYKTVAH